VDLASISDRDGNEARANCPDALGMEADAACTPTEARRVEATAQEDRGTAGGSRTARSARHSRPGRFAPFRTRPRGFDAVRVGTEVQERPARSRVEPRSCETLLRPASHVRAGVLCGKQSKVTLVAVEDLADGTLKNGIDRCA